MKKFWTKLKERWEITSDWQVLLILLVFAATGMTSLHVKKWIIALLGLNDLTGWIRIPLMIVVVFACYQVLLLMYGFLFGQFKFFWAFEKRFFGRMGKLLSRRSE